MIEAITTAVANIADAGTAMMTHGHDDALCCAAGLVPIDVTGPTFREQADHNRGWGYPLNRSGPGQAGLHGRFAGGRPVSAGGPDRQAPLAGSSWVWGSG